MEQQQWVSFLGQYKFKNIPGLSPTLPKGVYELNFDNFEGCFFLQKISDEFQLPERVYGMEIPLIERVERTFKGFDKNFGLLLRGEKGTGKTVTAKMIANQLGLPVILINSPWKNLGPFINTISQDIILFFDEFEKIFNVNRYADDDEDGDNLTSKNISNLLTLMDGVFTSAHKRLFLLTTNSDYLPETLTSRPSRIRYVKEFKDLSREDIILILNDIVKDKALIPGLAEVLSDLQLVSIDIVKSVAEEANLYGRCDKEFFELFNLQKIKHYITIYELKGPKKVEVPVVEEWTNPLAPNYNVHDDCGEYVGRIRSVNEKAGTLSLSKDGTPDKLKVYYFRRMQKKHVFYHPDAF